MSRNNLFADLKRRNVYKVVGGSIFDRRFDSLQGDPRFQKLIAKFSGESK